MLCSILFKNKNKPSRKDRLIFKILLKVVKILIIYNQYLTKFDEFFIFDFLLMKKTDPPYYVIRWRIMRFIIGFFKL